LTGIYHHLIRYSVEVQDLFRTILNSLALLAVVSLASPLIAQTATSPAPAVTKPPVAQSQVAQSQTAQSQVMQAPTPSAPAATPTAAPAPVDVSQAKPVAPPVVHDLSPWNMFKNADIIVQFVMSLLALASLATWTVGIAKTMELTVSTRRLRGALRRIAETRSLSEAQIALGDKHSVLSKLLAAAMKEGRMSAGISSDSGIKERAASSFSEIVRSEARKIRVGMGALATIGAVSPFVGLFGTVWGIMNSFIGISKAQTTNLAVVAPGIAEALLATAIGLVAAIPAVIIYNHFSRSTKGYLELVARASGAAGRLLSRDLDRTHVSSHGHSRASAAE
jgi:biopolymer transport protein ExbB